MLPKILYSTNPWIAHDIAERFLNNNHFAWVSEIFDPSTAPSSSATAAVATSSNPCNIYRRLKVDVDTEDRHSALIKEYKRTFKRLAKEWVASGVINQVQCDEIISLVTSNSWKIWRPVLYVIPAEKIDAFRIKSVPHKFRAGLGPELQIANLMSHEFDIIEFKHD
jgi:hypothetical protein